MQCITKVTHLSKNPIFNMIFSKQILSTCHRPYSCLISRPIPLSCLVASSVWNIVSKATRVLSVIQRSNIKALWFSHINSKRIIFNLFRSEERRVGKECLE